VGTSPHRAQNQWHLSQSWCGVPHQSRRLHLVGPHDKENRYISPRHLNKESLGASCQHCDRQMPLQSRGVRRGPIGLVLKRVKTLIVSSLPKFDGAPRTSAPPRPKIYISPPQSGVRATNAYRSSFSTANAPVSTALCTRGTRGRVGRRTPFFEGDIVWPTPFPYRPSPLKMHVLDLDF